MMNKPFIVLKIVDKKGVVVDKVGSRKTRRIFHFIKANKFPDCVFNINVSYGKGFCNSGEYETKKDLVHTLKAFLEKISKN